MNGYEEADKIDTQIGDLIAKTPITEETAREWALFARTVKSSVEIIEGVAQGLQVSAGKTPA